MADSVGGGFPTTGIQKGHTFFDIDEGSTWIYLGGIPRLVSSWKLVDGNLLTQPDTSLWGIGQVGAIWTVNGIYYGWDGSQIIEIANGMLVSIYNYKNSIRVQEDFITGSSASGSVGVLGL